MAMNMPSIGIGLDINSLYIMTVPLPTGAFHWALIHIDSGGSYTRHHWAAVTDNVHGRESYIWHPLPGGTRSVTDKNPVLGYFKVVGYTPVDTAAFVDICQKTFPTSYDTVAENRQHGLTCRTWILHIITKLMSDQRAQEVEIRVKKRSTDQSNEFANSFLWERQFMCVVESV
ncbi:hypothetical protein BC835DRAFT_856169 [Cytidiella melzeri]|nr:hypothetical protein BC835DRAFT_856169 [Cytidiella melzeri]